jgi:hypothetical protein
VSEVGPCVGDVPSEYAIPIPPADCPPEIVVEAFRPDEPTTVVVPHPRYPDEPSSRISKGPSCPAEPPATAGRVGSLLGLYPYSSTSLRLNSSASLRAFRFLHKKSAARTSSVTATIGTTTATATTPPLLRPELPELLAPPCKPAVEDADEDEEDDEPVATPAGDVGCAVEVIKTVRVLPSCVMMEVDGVGVAIGVVGVSVTVLGC